MACFRGNAAIERLPNLTDNNEIIHRALSQWTEHFPPRLW
jgi:hypothetical protein